jgi:hypothetical protein
VSKVYFVATKHAQYTEMDFGPGSTVIDPWRYIPEQTDVTIRRVGENKPTMISILVPSRGRPDWLGRTILTAFQTATHTRRIEFIVRLDEDDPRVEDYFSPHFRGVEYLVGPRALLSACWNECAAKARGEIMMHCGDDLTFDTPGWDAVVRKAFAETPDKILFAYGDDRGPHGETFGTHGFLHRKWVETVGYFVPPLFSSDWNDVWLNEVAKMIGRHKLLPFVTEHWHYTFGKAERDQTHAEREERGLKDGVVDLYKRTQQDRENDAAKLRAAMS